MVPASGNTVTASNFTDAPLNGAYSLAVDGANNVWVANALGVSLTEFNGSGIVQSGAGGYTGIFQSNPAAVAIDNTGRSWVVDQSSNTLTVLSSGSPIAGSPFTGGGLSLPNAIALDGNGTAWVSNGNGTLSAFAITGAAITPATGFVSGAAFSNGVAVDGSGNVWLTSCSSYCTGIGADLESVYELIASATPMVTPLALAVKNATLATEP